ncbi:MAG: FecR domain-containing protein [Prosthecobacter sp.]
MTTMDMNPDFELALARFLDGEATAADETLLVRAIETDAAARAEVRRHLLLEDLLRQHEQQTRDPGAFMDALRLRLSCADDEAFVQRVSSALHLSSAAPPASSGQPGSAVPPASSGASAARPTPGQTNHPKWRSPATRIALAAAAMLILSAVGAWMAWLWNGQQTSPPAVAQAASAPSAMATTTPAPLFVQTTPAEPAYAETSVPAMPDPEPMPTDGAGVVVSATADEPRLFTLPSKVRVMGSPGTSLAMVNAMLVKLDEGRVAADAGSAGKGFTVRTPQASIVDVGTLFGVQARSSGLTDVVVFSGEVLLTPDGPGKKATRLTTGQAVSVDDDGRLLRLASLTAPERWQFWQTEASVAQCIAAVEEPEKLAGVQAFHRIIPGGLKEGAGVAMGHPERWGAVTGKKFPRSLLGADYVQSPPVVTGATGRWPLRVSVQKAGTVYLLVSQAAPPPKWLTARFVRTGEEIASVIVTDGKPKARISSSYDVWKHTLAAPEVLMLGEPARLADGKPSPMYGIAAKPR